MSENTTSNQPLSISELENLGNLYLSQKQFLKAISVYEQCILVSPNSITYYWYLGLSWLLQGDLFQAQTIWFSAFTESNLETTQIPEFINFLKDKAREYLSSQELEFSQWINQAILEWCETDVEVYDHLAHTFALQGDLETAIRTWQTVIDLQPDSVQAYLNRGVIFQKLEQFEAAIQCYQAVIRHSPDYLIYYQLGLCYTQLKQWQLAINPFENSIQLQPNYAPAYSDLGMSLMILGLFDQGLNFIKQGIQKQPKFYQALIQNQTQSTRNINPLVVEFLTLLLSPSTPLIELYLSFSKILSRLHPDAALSLLKKAQNLAPNNFRVYLNFGDILYYNKHNYLEAIQSYLGANLSGSLSIIEDTISLEEKQANYHLALGKCRLKLESYHSAIANFKTVINLNYHLVEAYYGLGQALFQVGDIQEAIASLKQCLKFDPESALYAGYLGFLLIYNNQIEAGLFHFKKALKQESSIANFIQNLLNVLSESEKLNSSMNLSEIQLINPPNQFDQLTQNWIKSHPLNQHNYQQIYPETVINLTPPKSLDDPIHFSFRFGERMQLPAAFVVKIPQGRFWLSSDQTQSAILTNEQHFLGDLSPEFPLLSPGHPNKHPSHHSILSVNKLPPIHQINGTVAIIAGLSNSVYFHWMLDSLPRIELLKKSCFYSNNIDYFIVDNRLPFQQETLEKLEIPKNKQINIQELHHIQAQDLIVPSFPGCAAWMPKWTCDFLKRNFLTSESLANSPKFKRIYITRNSAKSRRILNENELLAVLQPLGFEYIQLESMSVLEQAALFSQAEIIIAPHGSGLTNLVFCQPQTQVIELFSPNYVYHCYWWISNLVGLDYSYYIGETCPGYYLHSLIYSQHFSEDILINIQEFLKRLERLKM
ncbi:tetratricopeptide repeat protein [Planktothrix paucivesiculata]|uniref:Glycosyltransferase 61 catalytic domain-containing protein n=1 Tax=Planktothrix paucivesiculata PCC 9631 TaxID=671071 RepID=A0A7Z9DVP7_9CYAN|nr:tetratricopeptide repeat protein [Planktothrix paucivesiculata]VXD10804.1 hypothetical protein PL9631_1010037 [Planktothrix paucivesiculata PCC 9631]